MGTGLATATANVSTHQSSVTEVSVLRLVPDSCSCPLEQLTSILGLGTKSVVILEMLLKALLAMGECFSAV